MAKPHIIDLSYDLESGTPVYPNYPPAAIRLLDSTDREAPVGARSLNSSVLTTGLHCGTHMDAPFHFFGERYTIEKIPLDRCIGPALLVSLPDHGAGKQIMPEDLAAHKDALRETRRVVLDTGWSRRWGQPEFFTDHPVITGDAARFLVDCGVLLIGVDFPSVDLPPHDAHLVLLGSDVLIVENLTNLDAIRAERFQLIALPLKIVGRDGSPVRAVAMEI